MKRILLMALGGLFIVSHVCAHSQNINNIEFATRGSVEGGGG